MIIRPQFEEVEDFDEDGTAAAQLNEKWGFIDKEGRVLVPFKYESPVSFSGGLVWFQVDDKSGYADRFGKIIWPPSK